MERKWTRGGVLLVGHSTKDGPTCVETGKKGCELSQDSSSREIENALVFHVARLTDHKGNIVFVTLCTAFSDQDRWLFWAMRRKIKRVSFMARDRKETCVLDCKNVFRGFCFPLMYWINS